MILFEKSYQSTKAHYNKKQGSNKVLLKSLLFGEWIVYFRTSNPPRRVYQLNL